MNVVAAAKVTTALERLSTGNFSSVKSVGEGVFEYRIDFGPGYRIYFGKDGEGLVILVAGGSKKRQRKNFEAARANWKGKTLVRNCINATIGFQELSRVVDTPAPSLMRMLGPKGTPQQRICLV